MQNNNLQILYEDEYIIAVNKPSKMLVHRSKIDRHETVFAVQQLRNQINQHVFSVHRLDKPTSGVLLFAKSSDVASKFHPMFLSNAVVKSYIAVVRGYIREPVTIDYPLIETLDKTTDNLNKLNPAREAITTVTPVAGFEIDIPVSRYKTARFSIVELSPKTGRKHQLRRHMAHLRHPIVEDTTHGDGKQNKFAREVFQNRRLLLHADKMSFQHPITDANIEIFAPFDEAFLSVISYLKKTHCEYDNGLENVLSPVKGNTT